MDLDPFVTAGIEPATMRVLDLFLLHCLLTESPPDTPDEIAALGRNQHRTAAFGRQGGLRLERGAREVVLVEWAAELLEGFAPIAAHLDSAFGTPAYRDALALAMRALEAPASLPSARVLAAMKGDFGGSYTRFIRAQADAARTALLSLPWSAGQQAAFERMAEQSVREQRAIEATDRVDFETWRLAYLAPDKLLA